MERSRKIQKGFGPRTPRSGLLKLSSFFKSQIKSLSWGCHSIPPSFSCSVGTHRTSVGPTSGLPTGLWASLLWGRSTFSNRASCAYGTSQCLPGGLLLPFCIVWSVPGLAHLRFLATHFSVLFIALFYRWANRGPEGRLSILPKVSRWQWRVCVWVQQESVLCSRVLFCGGQGA